MTKNILKLAMASAPVALVLAFATPASAVVTLTPGPYAPSASAVVTDGAQSGTSVTGTTVPGGVGFTFSSPTVLTTNASGSAKVGGQFHTLTLAPTSANYGFSSVDFDLDPFSIISKKRGFYADILLNLVGGGSVLFDNVSLSGSNNFFKVSGNAGEVFSSISFTGWRDQANKTVGTFAVIRSVNVDAVSLLSSVPEPSTWAMMIAGIGLVGASMRRRRTAGQAAVA